MADNDCGCAGPTNSPPNAASTPVASAFGGSPTVRRRACGPPKCAQPPVSEAEERSPFCADWIEQLTPEVAGKLLIAIEGCVYLLRSKCLGYVQYDPATEQVTVVVPDYVSSLPRETLFGFLAKVVPTIRKSCVDGEDTCEDEIHQELAAQVLGSADCGRILIGRPPICGELKNAVGNEASQVKVDYLDAKNHEDLGCPDEIRFLVQSPSDHGDANKTACTKWSVMRRLRMRQNQWGFIEKGNALESVMRTLVVVPVAGGTEENPCYEIRIAESAAGGGIPSGAANCDGIIWRNHGEDDEGWFAENLGVRRYYLETPQVRALGVNGSNTDYSDYNERKCSKLYAIVRTTAFVSVAGSGVGGSAVLTCNGVVIAQGYTPAAGGFFLMAEKAVVPMTSDSLAFSVTYSMTGSPVLSSQSYRLLGYEVD